MSSFVRCLDLVAIVFEHGFSIIYCKKAPSLVKVAAVIISGDVLNFGQSAAVTRRLAHEQLGNWATGQLSVLKCSA